MRWRPARGCLALGTPTLCPAVRRCTCRRHLRCGRLPPGLPARRLGRRRRLLRPFGVSDHEPALGGRQVLRAPGRLLEPPGQAAPPCGVGPPHRPLALRLGRWAGARARTAARTEPGHLVLRGQLAADRGWSRLLRPIPVGEPPATDVVVGDRRAVLPGVAPGDPGDHRLRPGPAPPGPVAASARGHRHFGSGLGRLDGPCGGLARA